MNRFKDKNRPKGAMSAYACFVQVIREEHKKKHPGEQIVFSDFSKKCAERWKLMTPKEKKRFEDLAAVDKERYHREMSEYVPPEGMKKGKKRKAPRDPTLPRRAWSAFFFFCDEHRGRVKELNPEYKVADVAKELGRQWETCQDKAKYELLAQQDKQRYEEAGQILNFSTDMAKYRAGVYVPVQKKPAGAASNLMIQDAVESHAPNSNAVSGPGGDENGAELEEEEDAEPDDGEEE
ncbi:Dorsal switch protein 1 [Fasciola gigantica]|uniref:Dorsal switch protein 1 n=1 Tax=Fasciola gigantica TaxID=46835 RepID=A0A504YDV6_FASGI|nr:Dorsal switch protein 1 [Fasciola gigantica]